MVRLKNRQMQIPGSLQFYLPQTKWKPRANSSFGGIVEGLLHHLQGNPHVAKQLGWPLTFDFLADKVDEYNATLCQKMGWTQYIEEVTAPAGGRGRVPFPTAHSSAVNNPKGVLAPLKNVAVGVVNIADMFGPDGPISDKALAEARAAKCAGCELNEKGDWTHYFTMPISKALKKALAFVKDQGMETSRDGELRVCTACDCPCGLKIWARRDHIISHMPPEQMNALVPDCWIKTES